MKRIPAQFDGSVYTTSSLLKKVKLKAKGYINFTEIQFSIELDPKSAKYVMDSCKTKKHEGLRGKKIIVLIK